MGSRRFGEPVREYLRAVGCRAALIFGERSALVSRETACYMSSLIGSASARRRGARGETPRHARPAARLRGGAANAARQLDARCYVKTAEGRQRGYDGGYLESFHARVVQQVCGQVHIGAFFSVLMTRTYSCGRAGTGTHGIVISCVGNAHSDVGQGFSALEINLLPERLIGSPDRALTNAVKYLISVIVFRGSKSWGPA
jgi:hypothetical protein